MTLSVGRRFLRRNRRAGFLLAMCGLLSTSLLAGNAQAYEFCKSEHSHRVIELWDGYTEWWGGRDGLEVKLVKSVQQALRDYDSKTNYIREYIAYPDGYFGYATDTAVRQLQQVEVAAGSVDGRVGRGVRSVLCNLNAYLGNCRAIVEDEAPGTKTMNGCGSITLYTDGQYLQKSPDGGRCEVTLTWLSGNGGTKKVTQQGESTSIRLATGVRNGARFSVRHNCETFGGYAPRIHLWQ